MAVRDTADRDGVTLQFTAQAWQGETFRRHDPAEPSPLPPAPKKKTVPRPPEPNPPLPRANG